MKLLVLICLFLVSEVFSNQTHVIPDCFVVKSGLNVKCYTITTDKMVNREESRRQCQKNNGDLALVTDDYTWNQITENLLNSEPVMSSKRNVWVRPMVKIKSQTLQDISGLNTTLFWSKLLLFNSNNDRCISAHQDDKWKWNYQNCYDNLPFLCEYNVSYCNMSDLNIEHANFNSCHSSQIVSNDESLLIDCWKGFVINGNANVTCKNGIWQEPFPTCSPGCKSPGQKKNSKFFPKKLRYDIGEEVIYICNNNYYYWKNFKKTHFTIFCQKHGIWSEKDSYCTDEKFTTITYHIRKQQFLVELNCTLLGPVTWIHAKENSIAESYSNSTSFFLDVSNITNKGFYFCQKEHKNDTIEVGSNFYKLVSSAKCDNVEIEEKITTNEGESVILSCQYKSEQISVKWYKNGKEIGINSAKRKIFPNNSLYLKEAQLTDEGIYKCEVIHVQQNGYCNYIVNYKLTVDATAESICGHLKNTVTSSTHQAKAPWLTVLQQDDEMSPFCYGSLLNNKWIVTSAFCLSNLRRKKEIRVHARFQAYNESNKYPVKLIRIHPGYRSRLYANDIGLIKLEDPGIRFSSAILPICLCGIDFGKKEKCDTGEVILQGEVSGWKSLLVVDSKEIKFAIENMSYVSRDKCSQCYGFSEDMFCAEASDNDTILAGDSGSPFVVNYNGRKYLMGIFNWGERITYTGKYDYFTNVYFHYDWIRETMKNN